MIDQCFVLVHNYLEKATQICEHVAEIHLEWINSPSLWLPSCIQLENVRQNTSGIVRGGHFVANRAWIDIDLMIVAACLRLIAEEMDLLEAFARLVNMPQCIRFVPSMWEHIEADFTANAVCQVDIVEFTAQVANHFGTHLMLIIVGSEEFALLSRTLPPDGANIHHAIAEFHECAPFEWQLQFGQIAEHKIDESLQNFFAQMLLNRLLAHLFAIDNLHQAIFRKNIVELLQNFPPIQLLEHFLQIRAAHYANRGQRFYSPIQKLLEFRLDIRTGKCQCTINIKQ